MVLQDLGAQITGALQKLKKAPRINEEAIDGVLKDICGALLRSDVNVGIVKEVRANIKKTAMESTQTTGSNRVRAIERGVYMELVRLVSPEAKAYRPKKGRSNVFMFVGLQGSGKTTSIAKFANYWHRKGWKCAMVCCDTFRAGAFDQLKQNATKLHVPYYGDITEADPVRLAEAGVKSFRDKGYEIILVDTSGRHRQEEDLFEEMEQVREVVDPDEVIFVMDSTIGQAVGDQAKAFRDSVPVGSVIITKLDGNAKGGGAISACASTNAPITFIGTGEHFDNFQPFDADSFVGELLGKGNLRALVERFQDSADPSKQKEMMQRIAKGQFTLRDFRDQLNSIMKMGSLSNMMSMLPSAVSQMMAGQNPEQMNKVFRQFICIMDSMNNDELDGVFRSRVIDPENPKKFKFVYEKQMTEERMQRLAKGAGVNILMVYQLCQMHRQFEKMVKMNKAATPGGGGMSRASMAKMMAQSKGNPKALMQQHLRNTLGPEYIKQMGGMDKVMEMAMAAQGGGAGGFPGGGMGMSPQMMQQQMASMMGGGRGGMMPPGGMAGMMGGMGGMMGGMGGMMGPGGMGGTGGRRQRKNG